jgi:hypothetical protein
MESTAVNISDFLAKTSCLQSFPLICLERRNIDFPKESHNQPLGNFQGCISGTTRISPKKI